MDPLRVIGGSIALVIFAAGTFAWYRYRREVVELLRAILEELRRRR